MSNELVAGYVAAYKPKSMTADRWALAAESVRSTVLATRPPNKANAAHYLSALVSFLNGPCGWDGTAAPDLQALLATENIHRYSNQLTGLASHTVRTRRGVLRMMARGIGAEPPRQALANPHPRRAHQLLVAGATRPIPVTVLVAAWKKSTGKALSAEPLKPAVAALKARGDLPAEATATPNALAPAESTVTASAPDWWALTEVTNQPLGGTVTSNRPAASTTRTSTTNAAPAGAPAMSRRAALRHARAARKARAAQETVTMVEAPEVSADIIDALDRYRPELKYRTAWTANNAVARRLVLGYRPTSPRNARNVCSQIAVFLTWYAAERKNNPGDVPEVIELAELTAPGLVERFVASRTGSDRSTASLRSTVRRALASLNPEAQPAKLSYQAAAEPYGAAECAQFVHFALHQPTPGRTKALCFIVGLGLGAGLSPRDLRHLTPRHLTEAIHHETPTYVVTVPRGRVRQIPVRASYAALLSRALELHAEAGLGDDDLLVGKVADRINVAAPTIRRAVVATETEADARTTLSMSLPRLRNTWLAAAMCSPVPMTVLMQAAGLASARTLSDLITHCPVPDPETVEAALVQLGASAPDTGRSA